MQIDKITSEKIPDEFNVIIEIPMNDNPVKYELDKESGAIFVDRFMQVSMFYPCNYGFIPNTYLAMEIQSMCWFYLPIRLYQVR